MVSLDDRLLFVVCCLMYDVVCCSLWLFVVGRLLVGRCLIYVHCVMSIACCLCCVVCVVYLLSFVVCCIMCFVYCPFKVVCCLLIGV